jgi:cytochrome c-type biogenesis protein CcmH/NrfG
LKLRRHITRLLPAIFAFVLCSSLFAEPVPSPERLLAEGRVDAAIVNLQSRINTAPNDAASYNLLCRAHLLLEEWDAGIRACQKSVALEPGNSRYHLWLGRVYGEKADHSNFLSAASLAKKVRAEFETAVELDPNDVEARSDLAEYYLEAPGIMGGGKDKAENQAKQVASLDPPQSHLMKARICEKKGDLLTAENEYRAAIQAGGNKPGTWLALAEFYRRNGRFDQMQDAIQHVSSNQGGQFALVRAAEILVRAKQEIPLAAQLVRRYLAGGTVEDAPAFKAHYLLGTLLEKQGNQQAAAEEYRAALALASSFTPAQDALRRVTGQSLQAIATGGSSAE